MAISDYVEEFAGKPVQDWEPESGLKDPTGTLPRIGLSYDDHDQKQKWTDRFAAFLEHPDAARATGLVIGMWDYELAGNDAGPIIEAIVAARDRLPNLTALFLGDITYEECEISWIRQSDVSPIFDAYAQMEHFAVRGGDGLSLGALRHERLKTLIVQTGGLNAEVVRAVCKSNLPALEHLELWLGDSSYGANTTVADLAPILSGAMFSNLHRLGLRNAEIADEIARAVTASPLLERIRVLDLSLGTLGDEGAQALLASPGVAKLEKLDIHHHFCTEEMVERLRRLPIEVDADEPQEADEYDGESHRYVSVGE